MTQFKKSQPSPDRPVAFLATGGSGGHIFPAIALADELVKRSIQPVFITDDRGADYLTNADHPVQVLNLYHGGGFIARLRKIISIFASLSPIAKLLDHYQPVVAIGFGSYVSLPTIYSANRFGCPIILHEQNAVMGRANRYLAKRADAIALSFTPTARIPTKSLDITHDIGNPVRSDIQALYAMPYAPPADDGPINLLITGGSQGASLFSSLIPAAIDQLPRDLQSRLHITHQCRPAEIDALINLYRTSQIKADVIDFITDMAGAIKKAHLIIGRAGAGTISEIACAKRPSILIPLASAIHNHQVMNARILADNGAAEILVEQNLSSIQLCDRLKDLLSNPSKLSVMSNHAKKLAHPYAAKRLANLVTAHLETDESPAMAEMAGVSA